jgi:WD40 repeat protein
MTGDAATDAAVRAWAVAHARTVGRSGDGVDRGAPAGEAASTGEEREWPEQVVFREEKALRGHSDWVWSVAWSPDPRRLLLATASGDGTARIWDPHTGENLHTFTEHTDLIWSVAWSPDPHHPLLATASEDSTVRIWDPRTGQTLHTLTEHTDMVMSVAWSPDPHHPLLATASRNGAQIWDPDTGQTIRTIYASRGWFGSVAWSPGPHHLLVSAGPGRTAHTWNPDTGETLHIFPGHTSDVCAVAWSPDPHHPLLATTSNDGTARIWDPHTGQTLHTLTGHTSWVRSVAWSPDPHHPLLATTSYDHTARIWNPHTGACLATMEHPSEVGAVAFITMPDGRLALATGSGDGIARIWTTEPPRPTPAPPTPRLAHATMTTTNRTPASEPTDTRTDEPFSRSLARQRPLLATGSEDDTVRVWDPETGQTLQTITGHTNAIISVAWLPDPHHPLLATAGRDGTARIWDPHTGQTLHTLTGHTGEVWSVAWSPDLHHPLLATAGHDGTARIWDPHTGQTLHTLTSHNGWVYSVAWSADPDHPLLATAGDDQTARIWDPDTGRILRTLRHTSSVWSTAWSPDPHDRLLATACTDGTVRIWERRTGQILHTLTGHTGAVWSVAWSRDPDHPLLATGGADNTVRIWDPGTARTLRTLRGHTNWIQSVAWSPDPHRPLLASAGNDHTVRIWDPESGEVLHTLTGHTSGIRTVAWLPPLNQHLDSTGAAPHATTPLPGRPTTRSLLTLGTRRHWIPLGLLTDLTTLTSPTIPAVPTPTPAASTTTTPAPPPLHNPILRALTHHPALQRLRSLGWPPPARGAFAALLTHTAPPDARYTPPPDAAISDLRDALDRALTGEPAATVTAVTAPVLDELSRNADAVTDKTLTLLTLLGPEACAADPMLPLTLHHHAAHLPTLPPGGHQLITHEADAAAARAALLNAQATARSPGRSGTTRHGPLTTATPTQLALPEPLLTLQHARGQLLHYGHPAQEPPSLIPLTIVLDTTPPTYGPCEAVLRLLAHLITTTLWAGGRQPTVITTTDPLHVRTLTHPADLVRLWSSRTLAPPIPALAAAVKTAADATVHPVLLLTTAHTAAELIALRHAVPTPRTQFATTHSPGTAPPLPPTGAHHHTLTTAPPPTSRQFDALIRRILTTAAQSVSAPRMAAALAPDPPSERGTAPAAGPTAAPRIPDRLRPQRPLPDAPAAELEFRLVERLPGPDGRVTAVSCVAAPDGTILIATGSSSGAVLLWGGRPGDGDARRPRLVANHSGTVFALAWTATHDELLLASGSYDGVRTWSPARGRGRTVSGRTGDLRALGWTHDGAGRPFLTAADSTGAVWLWDTETGACTGNLALHEAPTRSVQWVAAPDGRSLLATTVDSSARIWDGRQGRRLHMLVGHASDVLCTAWSDPESGPLLATGSTDGTARIWDGLNGVCLRTLVGHTDTVAAVAWTHAADGRPLVVTGGKDRAVRVWDALSGGLKATLVHPQPVNSVSATALPDGGVLVVTGSDDATTRVYRCDAADS